MSKSTQRKRSAKQARMKKPRYKPSEADAELARRKREEAATAQRMFSSTVGGFK